MYEKKKIKLGQTVSHFGIFCSSPELHAVGVQAAHPAKAAVLPGQPDHSDIDHK